MMRLYTAETRIVRGMYMCYVCKYLCTSEQLQGRNFVVNASILLIFARYQNNFNNDRNSDFEANISNIANVSKSKRISHKSNESEKFLSEFFIRNRAIN